MPPGMPPFLAGGMPALNASFSGIGDFDIRIGAPNSTNILIFPQLEGQGSPAFQSQNAASSACGCGAGESSATGESAFTDPSPIQPVSMEMPGFEGSQKLVFHDGEAVMEFYDKNGNHIDSMTMAEFAELVDKASEGDEEAIAKLEELGASEELIDQLKGEEGGCGCEEPSETPDTGLEDVSLEFNEETGEWELKTVESFDSYEEAKEAYEQAKCEGKDAGIRFNEETGKWEVQEFQSFDDLADAIEALEDLPEPVDRTDYDYSDVA